MWAALTVLLPGFLNVGSDGNLNISSPFHQFGYFVVLNSLEEGIYFAVWHFLHRNSPPTILSPGNYIFAAMASTAIKMHASTIARAGVGSGI
jgi:hypothetical protein